MKSIHLILLVCLLTQTFCFQASQEKIEEVRLKLNEGQNLTQEQQEDLNNLQLFNSDYFTPFKTNDVDDEEDLEEDFDFMDRIKQTPLYQRNYQQSVDNDEIDPYSEDLARMFAAFTQASYCAHRHIKRWKCGKPCKNYSGMKDVKVISNGIIKKNTAFLGYYEPLDMIVISWKGTIYISNWLEDFDFFLTTYPNCVDCKVHQGFYKTYLSMKDKFWKAFNSLRSKHPNAKIGLTGHSLGAALSTMNAADLISQGINGFVWYNYGSPRPGNSKFSTWLQSQYSQRLYRVTHHQDPVPHLPPLSFGFHHLAQEVFYVHSSKPNEEHILCNLSGEDEHCSNRYAVDLNVVDHVFYEGYSYVKNIAKCIL